MRELNYGEIKGVSGGFVGEAISFSLGYGLQAENWSPIKSIGIATVVGCAVAFPSLYALDMVVTGMGMAVPISNSVALGAFGTNLIASSAGYYFHIFKTNEQL